MTVAEPWLLLVHQLPARPVSLRVKTWRRLQQLGAVAVKNAVYALPNRAETREDFEWVRAEIVAAGGQATVFQASTIETVSSDELRESFRRARHEDYRGFLASVEEVIKQSKTRRQTKPQTREKVQRGFRDRLAQIERLDYFTAPGRDEARSALAKLEAMNVPQPAAAARSQPRLDAAAFQKRRWLTRPRPGIDRMGSAWLIRRFIDREARFVFGESVATRRPRPITFDMFEGDFTHEGDQCTFEVLAARFGLTEPRVREIGELVHDLDLKDGRFGRPEAPLLGTLVEGLQTLHNEDSDLLEHGIALFDALYHGQPMPPPARLPRRKPV